MLSIARPVSPEQPRASSGDCACHWCDLLPEGAPRIPADFPRESHQVNWLFRFLVARGERVPAAVRQDFVALSDQLIGYWDAREAAAIAAGR